MEVIKKDLIYIDNELKNNNSVYLYEELEEVCIKINPNEEYFAKFKREKEYKIEFTSNIVAHALMECFIITKEQYESW